MNEIKIIIPLQPISKKNSQRILVRHGRPFIMPSEIYKQYENAAGFYINADTRRNLNTPVNIKCLFYMKTRRKCDLVNMLEAVDDILTTYGVIEDDNFSIVASHDGSRIFYDKDNPRTEIYITNL